MICFVVILLISVQVKNCFESNVPKYCSSRMIIEVGNMYQPGCNSGKGKRMFCKTLDDVIQLIYDEFYVSDSCLLVYDNQTLHHSMNLNGVKNIAFIGNSSDISIECDMSFHDAVSRKDGIGFNIKKSSNISFENLIISKCGLKNATDICEEYGFHITSSSAFQFTYVKNIIFENVKILNSYGYGMFARELGGKFLLSNVLIGDNTYLPFYFNNDTKKGFGSGGGINILLEEHDFSSHLNIRASGSVFFNNTAETDDHVLMCKSNFSFPFGRGGGISLSIHGDVSNVKLDITDRSRFESNKALWGGGINFKTAHNSSQNLLIIDYNCVISENYAELAGGGLFVMGIDGHENNDISISLTDIKKNTATCGGGIALYGAQAVVFAQIQYTRIKFNSAFLGSGIYLLNSNVDLTDLTLTKNNKNWKKKSVAHGAIAAFRSNIYFRGNNKVAHNNNSGIVLDRSFLHVYEGKLSITNNTGQDGGGIAMYSTSQIVPHKGAYIYFASNTATNRGGAIFVDVPGPVVRPFDTFKLNRYKCFFNQELIEHCYDGVKYYAVVFVDNKALLHEGDAIYAETLQHCRNNRTYDLKKVFTIWNCFIFNPRDNTHNVVTSALNIQLIPEQWKPTPGFPFSPHIYLFDERNSSVYEGIQIMPRKIENQTEEGMSLNNNNNDFILEGNTIHVTLDGTLESKTNIEVTVEGSEVLPQVIRNITMSQCEFGFIVEGSKCVCDSKLTQKLNIQCVYNDLYITQYHWIENENATSSHICPVGYCKRCPEHETLTGFECLLNFDEQCSGNRDNSSYLCSKCKENYSVPLGSNDCKCKNTDKFVALYGVFYVVFILALEIFVAFINRQTYQNAILSACFFYKCSTTIIYSLAITSPLETISTALGNYAVTLPFSFLEVCISDDLNNLTKFKWLYAMACTYPVTLIILAMIVRIDICPRRLMPVFSWDAFWRTFNIFIMLFWFDLVHHSITILKTVEINNTTRVFVYADASYDCSQYKVYKIVAWISITVCIIFFFSMALSLWKPRPNTPFKRLILRFRNTVGIVFDAFKIGLKIDATWILVRFVRLLYTLFYMVNYTAVLLTLTYVPTIYRATGLSLWFLTMTLLVIILKPFESRAMNCFEVLILSILCLSCLLKDSLLGIYCPIEKGLSNNKTCTGISDVVFALSIIPAILLIVWKFIMSSCFDNYRNNLIIKWEENVLGKVRENNLDDVLIPHRAGEDANQNDDDN